MVPCAQGSHHNKKLSWLIKTVNKICIFVSIFCAAGLNGIMSVYIFMVYLKMLSVSETKWHRMIK
jgi:hypothetical protein